MSCIAEWAKVTNLCPLCKTRFKAITELPALGVAAAQAVAAAALPRAGLRSRGAKVVRVATRNQSVEYSSSGSDDGSEEERAAQEEATRHARATRAARRQRLHQSGDGDEEHKEEMQQEPPPPARARRGRAAASAAAAAAAIAPAPIAHMDDEELLAWALRESMRVSAPPVDAGTLPPPRAVAAAAAASSAVPPARRTRGTAAVAAVRRAHRQESARSSAAAASALSASASAAAVPAHSRRRRRIVESDDSHDDLPDEECKELDFNIVDCSAAVAAAMPHQAALVLSGDEFEASVPEAVQEFGDSMAARTKDSISGSGNNNRRKNNSAGNGSSGEHALEHIEQPREGQIGWMRTRDGKLARARATGLSADALLAHHIAQLQAGRVAASDAVQLASALPSASSSASGSASSACTFLASLSPAPRSAVSQASAALDSFEQRILQRKAAQQMQEQEKQAAAAAAAAAAELGCERDAEVSKPRGPRLSTTCDPRAGLSDSVVCAPGGLRIFKRRSVGVRSPHASSAPPLSALLQRGEYGAAADDADAADVSLASVGAADSDYASSEDGRQDENAGQAISSGVIGSLWSRMSKYAGFSGVAGGLFKHPAVASSGALPLDSSPMKGTRSWMAAPGGPPMSPLAPRLLNH
jgi:hypothetical protein